MNVEVSLPCNAHVVCMLDMLDMLDPSTLNVLPDITKFLVSPCDVTYVAVSFS